MEQKIIEILNKHRVGTATFEGKKCPLIHAKEFELIANEILNLLPTDKETEKWFDENIGSKNECSASSAIYKFRLFLKERWQKK